MMQPIKRFRQPGWVIAFYWVMGAAGLAVVWTLFPESHVMLKVLASPPFLLIGWTRQRVGLEILATGLRVKNLYTTYVIDRESIALVPPPPTRRKFSLVLRDGDAVQIEVILEAGSRRREEIREAIAEWQSVSTPNDIDWLR